MIQPGAEFRAVDWDLKTLEAPLGPPVRRIEKIAPVSIIRSPSGKTIVDFGQNLVGWLSIKVKGTAGHTVTLRHAKCWNMASWHTSTPFRGGN